MTSDAGVVVTLTPEGIGWAKKNGDNARWFPWTVVGGLYTWPLVGYKGWYVDTTRVLGIDGTPLSAIPGVFSGPGTMRTWLPHVVADYIPERYVATEMGDFLGGSIGCILRGAATERERSGQ